MKLSELLAKPFKLKGGATLNLKGFSKRVVDKEVGGSSTNNNGFTSILNQSLIDHPIYPHPSKVVNNSTLEIEDIQNVSNRNAHYKFLYKKSDIDNIPRRRYIISDYIIDNGKITFDNGNDSESSIYEIEGEEYVFLTYLA